MFVWPDTGAFKAWARIDDPVDDNAIPQAVAAANAHIAVRCTRLDPTATTIPEDVAYACLLLASRLLARRNSPEGALGSLDGVTADVGDTDPDVSRLIAPYVEPGVA